jgi:hypothetical protein
MKVPAFMDYRSLVNQTHALLEAHEPLQAFRLAKPALQTGGAPAPLWVNVSVALQKRGRIKASLAAAARAFIIAPDNPHIRFQYAVALMRSGNYGAAAPLYEARFDIGTSTVRGPAQMEWRGQPVRGRRILLTLEQGFGDVFQFLRLARWFAEEGAEVLVGGPPSMRGIVERFAGVSAYIDSEINLSPGDYSLPLMSRWDMLEARRALRRPCRSYLFPDQADVARVRPWIRRAGRPLIGLAIDGRSFPLAQNMMLSEGLARVLAGMDVDCWLLDQSPPNPLDRVAQRIPEGVLGRQHGRWEDVAAIVANVDLVISIDTALGHLAGAMGVPVALMLRRDCCWRWGGGWETTYWYPNHRLYRQHRGEWGPALMRLQIDLPGLLGR